MLPGSILEKLTIAHQNSRRSLNLGVYYKNTLVALCHALEDFILEANSSPLMIAAFQRGKWYLEEAEHYGELAKKAAQIVILASPDAGFTEHPTSKLDNVALVALDDLDPVAREWHLIILSPTYTAMVLCQELSEADYAKNGLPQGDLERKFYGFWTFEPDLVRETVDITIAHLTTYNPSLASQLCQQVAQITNQCADGQRDDLSLVVSRVINYLQSSQQDLLQPKANAFASELDDNLISNEMQAFLRMAQIIDQADMLNPMAAAEVATLAEAMGQLLDLPLWQVRRLRLAGLLHRLGSITPISSTKQAQSPAQQQVLSQQDNLPKASVLRIMPQLHAIANIIQYQYEHWDGSGRPEGLAYDQIPLESRILCLLSAFQRKLAQYQAEKQSDQSLNQALIDCQSQAGIMYDPKLLDVLTLLVMAMQQGMNLAINQPKIAAGMWLLEDSDYDRL